MKLVVICAHGVYSGTDSIYQRTVAPEFDMVGESQRRYIDLLTNERIAVSTELTEAHNFGLCVRRYLSLYEGEHWVVWDPKAPDEIAGHQVIGLPESKF